MTKLHPARLAWPHWRANDGYSHSVNRPCTQEVAVTPVHFPGERTAKRQRAAFALLVLGCLSSAGGSAAQTVHLKLDAGQHAEARYYPGRGDRPAVMLVHDFLATAEGTLTDALARRLARDGVALLVPTLSLGVLGRRAPLACEAVHLHVFEQDIAELRRWVEWLLGKGRTRIVLVGQRFGGWQALALAQRLLSPALQAVIMISPRRPGQAQDLAALRTAAAQGKRELVQRPLLSCQRFVGPADSIYSYASWDAARMLDALSAAPIAVRAIVGGRDTSLNAAWRQRLGDAGALVQLVPDAVDFRDPRHLAALLELIVASLMIEG